MRCHHHPHQCLRLEIPSFIIIQVPQKVVTISSRLAEHPHFLKDMLDIGLRPTYFQKTRGVILTNDLPALAIDTLVNLYEDFIDLLACKL